MMQCSRLRGFVLCGAVLLVASALAAADQPTPTPTPRVTPSPRATPSPPPATSGRRSLADVARDTRIQGSEGESTSVVITNDNLAELSAKGGLTSAGPTVTPTALPGTRRAVHGGMAGEQAVVTRPVSPESDTDSGADDRRRHWRALYLKQIEVIDAMRSQIEHLDEQIPGLWNQFYAWDDPAYRDGVIKPKLDAALAQRQQLEEQIASEEARLPQILDDARRDGALPGWFRDLPVPTPSSGDDTEAWGVMSSQP